MNDRKQLEDAIVALESQRAILGDAVVDSSIELIRQKLAAMQQEVVSGTGERKLVTVMFADIAGFTAFSEKNDPEVVRALINDCFSWMVPFIEKYDGVVEKFIGDEIMAIFGAPAAHENDGERALRSALDMMIALEEFNHQRSTSLGMHIGINSGLVVAGQIGSGGHLQYGVTGDTVNLAARLKSLASEGQILIGSNTFRLTAGLFETEMLPPVQLKGKADPVPIYRLLGLIQEPMLLSRSVGLYSPLVGRDAELKTLVEMVMDLKQKKGGILSIVAEAGLGKSRLVSEAHERTSSNAIWIGGRGASHLEGMSYYFANGILDHLIGAQPNAGLEEINIALISLVRKVLPDHFDQVYPYLARFRDLPVSAPYTQMLQDLVPEALKNRIHTAWTALLRACARQQPLVVVLEDLHWADPSSLALFESLFSLIYDGFVLFLLVFRPNEGRSWGWHMMIADQFRERYRVMELLPLTQADSALLAENLLKIEGLPTDVKRLVLERSEGNPFFMEELLHELIDSGMVLMEGTRATAAQDILHVEVPDTLQGIIAARIDRLPAEQKYTLQTASVLGRIFQQTVLERLLQVQQASIRLDITLSELKQRELIRWRSEREYIFKHIITRDVTYQSLLIERRRELHRLAAETLEILFANQLNELATTLAYHFDAAGQHQQAADYYHLAGDLARDKYSNIEAVAFYQAAIQHWSQVEARDKLAALYEQVGRLLTLIGKQDEAVEAYESALSFTAPDDRIARARIYRLMGGAYNLTRQLSKMMELYDQALVALGVRSEESTPEWIELQLDRMWGLYWMGSMNEVTQVIAQTHPVIDRFGSLDQRARWLGSLVTADLRRYRYFQLPDETLSNARNYVLAAKASGSRRLFGRAQSILGFVHLWRNELDEAEKYLLEGWSDVSIVGDVDTELINLNYMALIWRKRNDAGRVEEWAQRTLKLAEKTGNQFYEMNAHGSLAWVQYHLGSMREARRHLQKAMAYRNLSTSPTRFFILGPALAMAADEGDLEHAVEYIEMLLEPHQQKMPDEVQAVLEQVMERWQADCAAEAGVLLAKGVALMDQLQLGYV
jgi:class 3 adenylate cyclase/tetratricopeptide (TPR) repeat protein